MVEIEAAQADFYSLVWVKLKKTMHRTFPIVQLDSIACLLNANVF